MDWSLSSLPALDTPVLGPQPLPRPSIAARLSNRLAMHLPVAPFDASAGRGLVTFTFDDAPVSAATHGADLLAEHDVLGTYYIATALLGTYAENWQVVGPEQVVELHHRGHEIGSHGHLHCRIDAFSTDDMLADLARNRATLLTIEPSLKIESFAYPYGYASISSKYRLRDLFRSSRSIHPHVNTGRTDKQHLGSLPLIAREMNETGIDRAMAKAAESNGWAIFYAHDIAIDHSDYGCTPGLLSYALKAARKHGLATTTVAQGLAEKEAAS